MDNQKDLIDQDSLDLTRRREQSAINKRKASKLLNWMADPDQSG